MIIHANTTLGAMSHVYKDGVELKWCFEVDSEGTYALCYKVGAYGFPYIDSTTKELAFEKIENVTVVTKGEINE